jgi:hypothetical protein
MSDPKHEPSADGESDVQASNDGTAALGEEPNTEPSFDTESGGE